MFVWREARNEDRMFSTFYRRFDVMLRHHHTARRTVDTKVGRGAVVTTAECAMRSGLFVTHAQKS
jgi:hypothetical protein